MKMTHPAEPLEGMVTARTCRCCGHHEIGIVTASGDYFPLKPGMHVRITDSDGPPPMNRTSTPSGNEAIDVSNG